jgi:PPK2 family polyphosphate:nucleotide phosphotransferase
MRRRAKIHRLGDIPSASFASPIMPSVQEMIAACKIDPKAKFRLKDHDPAFAGNPKVPKEERRKFAEETLSQEVAELAAAQELLYASDSWSVLLIFQAMDAAGKDGTIKHVMSGVNPQGVQVTSFKHPSAEELDHTFLWRCIKALPERGRIGIFNRSYYEEVLVVKVHQELVRAQRIPAADPDKKKFWDARYYDINAFERHLTRNGTKILKFFLNVSKGEQKERFLARLENTDKHWKFSPSDLNERGYWDDYQRAYEQMIAETSTKSAPWYVIPADYKWVSRALVARIVSDTIASLKIEYPEVTPAQKAAIEEARARLLAEQED